MVSRYDYTLGQARSTWARPPLAGDYKCKRHPILRPECYAQREDEEFDLGGVHLTTMVVIYNGRTEKLSPIPHARNDTFIAKLNERNAWLSPGVESIKHIPIYKVDPPNDQVKYVRQFGVIAGVVCNRVINLKPTKRETWVRPEAIPEPDLELEEAYAAHYAKFNPKPKTEVDDLPEALRKWVVKPGREGTNAELVRELAAQEREEREDLAREEGLLVGGEFSANQALPKFRSRNPREHVIFQPIDFLGVPKNQTWETKEEKMLTIGVIFLHAKSNGRNEVRIHEVIGKYFGIGKNTVIRYGEFAAKMSVRKRLPKKLREIMNRFERRIGFKGQWVLKTLKTFRYQPPWTTLDGLRPMFQWGKKGAMDRSYAAKFADLRVVLPRTNDV